MNYKKLHRGNFPDPEFYSHVGTYGDWKAYAAKEAADGFVKELKELKNSQMLKRQEFRDRLSKMNEKQILVEIAMMLYKEN